MTTAHPGAPAPANDATASPRRLLLPCAVVLALAASYVVPAAYFPLSEPDEARYAEVAREMQILTLDMPLTCWVTAAMTCFWLAHADGRRSWLRLAAVTLAAGTLTKGPVAVVLAAVPVGVFTWLRGRPGDLRRLLDPLGLLLLVAIAAPWFGIIDTLHPGFLASFLGHHHLERFASPWHHREPFWFFGAILPVATFPWGPLALMDRAVWPRIVRPTTWTDASWFLALWASWPVLLFTVSQSKLIPYIMPALPPLAILAGRALVQRWHADPARTVTRTADLLGSVGAATLVVGLVLPLASRHARAPLLQPYVLASGCALLIPAWLATRIRPRRAALALGAGIALLLSVAVTGRTFAKDYRDLGHAVARLAGPSDRVAVYRRYIQGLPFYAKRPVLVIGDDEQASPNRRDLTRMWAADERVLLLVDRDALDELRPTLRPPPHVLASSRTKLLVSNRAPDDS